MQKANSVWSVKNWYESKQKARKIPENKREKKNTKKLANFLTKTKKKLCACLWCDRRRRKIFGGAEQRSNRDRICLYPICVNRMSCHPRRTRFPFAAESFRLQNRFGFNELRHFGFEAGVAYHH